MNNLFNIPTHIKVGFVNREGTYDGRLSFVTRCDDAQGSNASHSHSFERWRDKEIEPVVFENKPVNNIFLNRSSVKRSSYFGSNNEYIRIYDSRGFEYEITAQNLLHILDCNNSNNKELLGEYVYCWPKGKDKVVLLPTNSMDYEKSVRFTQYKSAKKLKAKDFIVGNTYLSKNMEMMNYVGFFTKLYTARPFVRLMDKWYSDLENIHVFYDMDTDSYLHRTTLDGYFVENMESNTDIHLNRFLSFRLHEAHEFSLFDTGMENDRKYNFEYCNNKYNYNSNSTYVIFESGHTVAICNCLLAGSKFYDYDYNYSLRRVPMSERLKGTKYNLMIHFGNEIVDYIDYLESLIPYNTDYRNRYFGYLKFER